MTELFRHSLHILFRRLLPRILFRRRPPRILFRLRPRILFRRRPPRIPIRVAAAEPGRAGDGAARLVRARVARAGGEVRAQDASAARRAGAATADGGARDRGAQEQPDQHADAQPREGVQRHQELLQRHHAQQPGAHQHAQGQWAACGGGEVAAGSDLLLFWGFNLSVDTSFR